MTPDPISVNAAQQGAQVAGAGATPPPTETGNGRRFDEVLQKQALETERIDRALNMDMDQQLRSMPQDEKMKIEESMSADLAGKDHPERVQYFAERVERSRADFLHLERMSDKMPPSDPQSNRLADRLDEFRGEYNSLDGFLADLSSGKPFGQAELLAVQIRLHKVTQSVEVLSKMVEHSVSGMKQVFQTNV